MSDISLSMSLDEQSDDLPRTLRRKSLRSGDDDLMNAAMTAEFDGPPAVVTDIRVPFWRLVVFCFKLALAAIPAIITLAVVLHLMTEAMVRLYPDFRIWQNHLEYGSQAPRPAPLQPVLPQPAKSR